MYDKRIKIFLILSILLLMICILRLVQIQLLPDSSLQDDIAELKRQRGLYRQLGTVRGKILDRNGKVLAVDEPQFQLCIDYKVSCFADERLRKAKLLKAARDDNADSALPKAQEQLRAGYEDLQHVIDKCAYFGFSREDIENRIKQINDKIWNLRGYLAWKRNYPDRDFVQAVPDVNERLLLTAKVDIAEMHRCWPLLELKADDDIFAAQVEFMDVNGVQVLPQGHRFYPYGSAAAQTIGWVGPATQEQDIELFENDRLASYLDGEVCGREDGVEYVCEAVLRGRRGELVYDIDQQLVSRTETQFGEDVSLTLDIELQQRIENYLADSDLNPNYEAPAAVVVIDVATTDILALVSMPVFDLNRVRYDYGTLVQDPNNPLINRAICEQYPPGSVVKPLILIAGLESGEITPDEVINCPAQDVPKPTCLQFTRFHSCHDWKWENSGGNKARNAIKGSCNIYFSRLADRIEPVVLQQWLFRFGYGHAMSLRPQVTSHESRNLRQVQGQISTAPVAPTTKISSFEQIPPLKEGERRFFGIGQGNLRATPLQVANTMAAIARNGVFEKPRLFKEILNSDEINLGISPQTLAVVRDGMGAVVNEPDGTAYKQFSPILNSLAEQDVTVYGKTGSTERPDHAWFGGFAEDSSGRGISIAAIVEGGQHGSSDAAPLARDIIQFCIEAGYIGQIR